MTTLFDVLLRVAGMLAESFESSATGGSATTLVDTANPAPNDYWNNGCLFLIAGPRVGTTVTPTDWDASTKTLTIPTGTAITTANRYLLLPTRWQRGSLALAINTALAEQQILAEDETLTADSSKAIALPSGVSDVMQVWVGSDADGWEEHHEWREAQGEITFYANVPSSGSIRLVYATRHARLKDDTDEVDDQIDLDLLHLQGLASLHQKRFDLTKGQEPNEEKLAKQFTQLAMIQRNRQPSKINPSPRYSGL